MAQSEFPLHRAANAGLVRRLVGAIWGSASSHRASARLARTLDVDAMFDTGSCLACQDYAAFNGPALGEARRLHNVANVALGTFPH